MKVDPMQILAKLSALYNIPVNWVTPPFEGLENFDYGLRKALDPEFDWQEFGHTLLKQTPEKTFLIAEGTFELKFALFHVPDEVDTVLMIGPWTTGPRSEKARQWAKKHLGEAGDAAVQEYYNGVRVLQSDGFTAALYAVASVMMAGGVRIRSGSNRSRNFCRSCSIRIPGILQNRPLSGISRSP